MEIDKEIRWLQLSDLHIYCTAEWNEMLQAYKEVAKKFKPDFILITGDLCQSFENKNYEITLAFLNEIAQAFNLRKSDFFFVPGNHDVSNVGLRKILVSAIRKDIEEDPDCYYEHLNDLKNAFSAYAKFIEDFYGDEEVVPLARKNDPAASYHSLWNNEINIVSLNTALISDGSSNRDEILDVKNLKNISEEIVKSKPTLVIAHHSHKAIRREHRHHLRSFFLRNNVSAYLCGDEHKTDVALVEVRAIQNQTICVVCGKSAPQTQDTYSDVGFIGYTWKGASATVQVYQWTGRDDDRPFQFVESNHLYTDVNQKYSFPMRVSFADDTSIQVSNFPEEVKTVVRLCGHMCDNLRRIDQIFISRLGPKKVLGTSGELVDFKTENMMRSLLDIGLPIKAVEKILELALFMIWNDIPANPQKYKLKTKEIRLKLLEAIKCLDSATEDWSVEDVGSWCLKYVRRYGHNNRSIEFYNVPKELNAGKTKAAIKFRFIKKIFLPDLLKSICPAFSASRINKDYKQKLSREIINFLSSCDLYSINYEVAKNMVIEMITKPPHPWLIGNEHRKKIVAYDRKNVVYNLKEIKKHQKVGKDVPVALIIDLLHHASAMILDCYFNFLGCSDLDSFDILYDCFNKLLSQKLKDNEWHFRFESDEVRQLINGFEENNLDVMEYYKMMSMINPNVITNSPDYISNVVNFANQSLNIINSMTESLKLSNSKQTRRVV